MRIASVRIQNLRSYKDEKIEFDNYTVLVGENGAGKSTVLTALNVFFREPNAIATITGELSEEDFHAKDTSSPIRVEVTFDQLGDEAKADFASYVRQDKLTITAEAAIDPESEAIQVTQYGSRLGFDEFREFFEREKSGARVSELKDIYRSLSETYPTLGPPGTKDAMIDALRTMEAAEPNSCVLIPSSDQFYGFSKGANRLARHVQWVYVPAVKDASTEQVETKGSALGRLLSRTVRSKVDFEARLNAVRAEAQEAYDALLKENQSALDGLSQTLSESLLQWSHPGAGLNLRWRQDPEKSVRVEEPLAQALASEGGFEGEIGRFGHGLQRSYLMALLQLLASADDDGQPRLILGCEEPELYQHPPQIRHLAVVLRDLSSANTQVLVTTHDPRFVSGSSFEEVRRVTKIQGQASSVQSASLSTVSELIADASGEHPRPPTARMALLSQVLQPALADMFFSTRVVLVEGLEDAAYIQSYMALTKRDEEFRRLGAFVVPVNGKSSLVQPLAVCRSMEIPVVAVFDSDGDKEDKGGSRAKHEKDNRTLLALAGTGDIDPFPTSTTLRRGVVVWRSEIGKEVEESVDSELWAQAAEFANSECGHAGKLAKNVVHIGARLAHIVDAGTRPHPLEQLVEHLLNAESYLTTLSESDAAAGQP